MKLTVETKDLMRLLLYLKIEHDTIVGIILALRGNKEWTIQLLNYILVEHPTQSDMIMKVIEITGSANK